MLPLGTVPVGLGMISSASCSKKRRLLTKVIYWVFLSNVSGSPLNKFRPSAVEQHTLLSARCFICQRPETRGQSFDVFFLCLQAFASICKHLQEFAENVVDSCLFLVVGRTIEPKTFNGC